MRSLQALRNARVVLEYFNAADNIYRACFLNGLARIECLKLRKLLISLSQTRRSPSQNSAALSSGRFRPSCKRRVG